MHERDHEPGHIPPPDPHRQKRVLGLKPHHLIGGLVLIAILIIYLLLLVRRSEWVPKSRTPAPASSYSTPSNISIG